MASLTGTETASSSCAPRRWIYDVFLNFRGADTRNNFVDHLYTALIQKSVYTFKDDEQLETGMSIPLELLRAIQESMFAVIVFSRNYATSSWCLDELVKIMECRNLTGQTVIPVFYHVEPSVVRYQIGSFADAFAKHEVRCKEKVPGWREALIEATSISGLDVSNTANGRESKCIEILVDKIVHEKSHMVSSVVEQFVRADSLVENIQSLSLHKIQEDPGNIIHNHDFSWGVDEPWKLMHRETLIGGQQWEEMEGFTFCLPRKDGRLFFYLEGPPPQVDLLIASVALREVERSTSGEDINIIQNPKFVEDGKQWARTMCRAEFVGSLGYAKTTNRVGRSSGIQQEISARLQTGLVYELNVGVRVSGDNEADVAPATNEKWVKLQGKFSLPYAPLKAVIRLEGPPPGTDIFVTGLRVCGHQAPSDLDLRNGSSYGIKFVE
ncbi:hypothetical protein RJ640_027671 [Escallonia rubra]|uniref:ADP-ribosyl cyclase/cyclic ADP-ribose hydrolase n=1 Tax=Escallonia rubra TaxID=112253 RepID=A0AA88UUD3_9ASTE|nr:hypothetical protein RJ640_027671 [Escallonia rubra]